MEEEGLVRVLSPLHYEQSVQLKDLHNFMHHRPRFITILKRKWTWDCSAQGFSSSVTKFTCQNLSFHTANKLILILTRFCCRSVANILLFIL